ncbi:hypothetical protein ACIHFE_18960 [Streptomyces sp. NPDC052396]|uniref:SCO4983 family protein n=1 Tax=Streptomyces sp. NPDC052396 TaxID=3365689 RepID=UPI0037D5E3CA
MYEPIRTPSPHAAAAQCGAMRGLHRSRAEELDIRLAGHLTALLTVTDELRALTASPELDAAAGELAVCVARLRGGDTPLRAAPSWAGEALRLHQRAHMLAGQALVVATQRGDQPGAALAARRLAAHAAALGLTD